MRKHKAKEHRKFINRHCNGKRRISSARKARYIAELMTVKKKSPFVAYKCEHCGFYHVGHKKTKTSFYSWLLTPHHRDGGRPGI